MKTLSFGRQSGSLVVVNALLTIVLTVLSFRYVEPKNCYRPCGQSLEGRPCSTGGCPVGAQKAGWPLPVFIDSPGGGSPTNGWGLLGPEDIPSPVTLLLDVLFYSLVLFPIIFIVQAVRKQAVSLRPILISFPLNVVLSLCLWLFYLIFGSSLPLGRGQSLSLYIVDTPRGRFDAETFSPRVSIPVQELIQNYGDPTEVWLDSEVLAGTSNLKMRLYWDAIGMLAELSEIQNKTYSVEKSTKVKMILFPQEEPVLALEGRPVGQKKIPWTGYGSYQP